jgi:hypothetical protein
MGLVERVERFELERLDHKVGSITWRLGLTSTSKPKVLKLVVKRVG